jgi:hypothetical protein
MCECGRRTSGWIGLIPEVHGCDKTAIHSEYVENLAVRKQCLKTGISLVSALRRLGHSSLQECQQVGVNCVRLGCGHSVGKALVSFQCAISQQLCR